MALGREAVREDAFDFVFNAHNDYVYNLAYILLRNVQDAEDVTQEVFLRVYRALPTFEPGPASVRTWLTRLVTNACLTHRRRNFLRRLLQHTPIDGSAPDPVDSSSWGAPEDLVLQAELRQTLKHVLAQLRMEHCTVLVLRYYLDLSCSEIASILDCPEGTVYSRLYYARRILHTQLERRALHPANEVKPWK